MDFGSGTWDGGLIGIPYNLSDNTTPKYDVSFLYSDQSDPGPYPIPASPNIEDGSDHHLLDLDQSTCKLYEMWDVSQNGDGTWSAGSGAIWDLNSDALRPAGWTSADAAGLPILPGLVRYDEVASGQINHAIRFTANSTNSYIWPARHLTSGDPGVLTTTPPMGARFRLKASFDISGYPAQVQVILQAMKTYGIILADNGSDWYISGAPNSRWDNTMLHLMDNITGSDFEAVDYSSLMVNPDSGATSILTISGNVGVGNVTLSYIDGTAKTAISAADGSYSFTVSYNWSGTVIPTLAGYTFSPTSQSYTNVTSNQTQNYTATRPPVAVFRPSNGKWYINEVGITQYGTNGDIPVPADYTGVGHAQLAVFRPSNGKWYINGVGVTQYGTNGDIPVPADYNRDGKAELAVFRPSNGKWYINGVGVTQYGTNGDIPVPADYAGAGYAQLAVFRPSNGKWYINGVGVFAFGTNGDIPVPADYNKDGKAEIAVFRPSNGKWYIYGGSVTQYGTNGDIPIPGDYTGAGNIELAVFRQSNGKWYINGVGIFAYGTNGDIPIPGHYQ